MKNTLRNLCNYNRHGIAYGSDCTLRLSSWYADDEKNSIDYIGDGNVEIIGWKPYFEENIKVILTNEEFFKYLRRFANRYEREYSREVDIKNSLNIIKARLNI